MSTTHSVPLLIPPEHPALPGHFPGAPVVPGVLLLQHVADAWKAWLGATVGGLDAKFLRPLRPGEAAVITLAGDAARVRFKVATEAGEAVASGTMTAARLPACGSRGPGVAR